MARLYSVAHYAIGDTRRPLRFALVRLVVVTGLGYYAALLLPPRLGIATEWGAAGLTASAGIAGWIEFALLRASLNGRIGRTGLPASYVARLWISAAAAALLAWMLKLAVPVHDPLLRGALLLPVFGAAFLGVATAAGIRIPGLRR
jgi:putative peptidoglycan lipid II flippase